MKRNLFKQLEERLFVRRTYRINPSKGFETLARHHAFLQRDNFDPARITPVVDETKNVFICADMCVRGPGGQAALAKQWKLPLPADYLDFTHHYAEYILATRCPVRISPAATVETETLGAREGSDIPEEAPHRLFHFAMIIGEPGDFIFRWSENFKKMDVVVARDCSVTGPKELLGPKGDQYITDANFTAWLTRMLDTEGYPLVPGKRELWRSGLKRIK